jgi:hypothetical protein
MIKVMTIEEIYQAEQELERYNSIMSFKEILTQEEYEFCKEWDAEEAEKYLNNIGPAWKDGGFNGENRYLNINVYSEADKEEYDLKREMGI